MWTDNILWALWTGQNILFTICIILFHLHVYFHIQNEKGGRFEGISNFFNKLNPTRRAKSTSDTSLTTLDPNVPSKVVNQGQNRPYSQPANNLLPPIATDSKGRLTVSTPLTPQPPRSAGVSHPGISTETRQLSPHKTIEEIRYVILSFFFEKIIIIILSDFV